MPRRERVSASSRKGAQPGSAGDEPFRSCGPEPEMKITAGTREVALAPFGRVRVPAMVTPAASLRRVTSCAVYGAPGGAE